MKLKRSFSSTLVNSFSFVFIFFITLFSQAKESSITEENLINVVIVNPSVANDPFWEQTEALTSYAAKQLNIQYSVIHEGSSKISQFGKIKEYIDSKKQRIDYIVLSHYPGNAKAMMDYLNKKSIKVVTLEQTLSQHEQNIIGAPRGKYKNWIGEIAFSNEQAGYSLASHLLNAAIATGVKPLVAGISGMPGSETIMRNKGLISATRTKNAKLIPIVHAGWSPKMAYDLTIRLLSREPDINVIWCASDNMALAAISASETLGRIPGKDIFVGGFDWTNNAITQIGSGRVSASVGGHFVKGAIAMLLIYNEENGLKYVPNDQSNINLFSLSLITKANAAHYKTALNIDKFSEIDFKEIAKIYGTTRDKKQLNLLSMFEA